MSHISDTGSGTAFEREIRFNSEIAMKYREGAIKPSEFVAAGLVTAAEVAHDDQEVYRIKHSPDYIRNESVEAAALEFAVLKLFDDGEFGGAVRYAQKASEFDDVVRGVDVYVDLGEGGEIVPLGIDVTTSGDLNVLLDKTRRSTDVVRRGELTKLKYFYNGVEADGGDRKKLYLSGVDMPRVILGISKEAVAQLQWDLLNKAKNIENKYIPRFLEQISSQLEKLYHLAPARSLAKEKISRVIERVEDMYKEKDLRHEELRQVFGEDLLVNSDRLSDR